MADRSAGGAEMSDPMLRLGDNPVAHQLIEENDRLRRERNDYFAEVERLRALADRFEREAGDGLHSDDEADMLRYAARLLREGAS
jgi:hypothetical protein